MNKELVKSEYQRIYKGIERWAKSVKGIVEPDVYERIYSHLFQIQNILELAKFDKGVEGPITGIQDDDADDREWMKIIEEE